MEAVLDDTAPAYRELLRARLDLVAEIAATPLSERVGDYRMCNRVNEVVARLLGPQVRFVE